MDKDHEWTRAEFCYLTTTGRTTGRPHTVEIWFGYAGNPVRFFLLSGGGRESDWIQNLLADPAAHLAFRRDEPTPMQVVARLVGSGEEERLARELLAAKYQGWNPDQEMTEWARTALCIALEPKPIWTTGPIDIPKRK